MMKVKDVFYDRRFSELNAFISNDRILLGVGMKSIRDALSKERKVYKTIFQDVENLEMLIKGSENKLFVFSTSFGLIKTLVLNYKEHVFSLIDKISCLIIEKYSHQRVQ